MKTPLLILLLLISGLGFSQTVERVSVSGKISVPSGDDPEGITIFNTTSQRGTVSDNNGEFILAVAEGDIITFTALRFQEFSLIIDRNVVEARALSVFVTESATQLPEVVVTPFDLSGNVRVDVQRIPDPSFTVPVITADEVFDASLELRPGALTSPENAAMRDSFMKNGLNFANIFREILSLRSAGQENFEPLTGQVRELYDDEFFREHLNIDRNQITEFILYADENGLTKEMLLEGHDLELIEFLIMQSQKFKAEGASEQK